jgi:hypothetical protein
MEGATNITMLGKPIRARKRPERLLETKSINEVCKDYVDGYCANGPECSKTHVIYHIAEAEVVPPQPLLYDNELSLAPRLAPTDGNPFEDDGPGMFAKHGPKIKIFPTTDEVST